MHAGWFLEKVIVTGSDSKRGVVFPCARWLARDEDDGQISRDLLPLGSTCRFDAGWIGCGCYWMWMVDAACDVWTNASTAVVMATQVRAGWCLCRTRSTCARAIASMPAPMPTCTACCTARLVSVSDVSAVDPPQKGTSGQLILNNAANNFERGRVDVFDIECEDLGILQAITVGHDNSVGLCAPGARLLMPAGRGAWLVSGERRG